MRWKGWNGGTVERNRRSAQIFMIKSMTGFGTAEGDVGGPRVSVEIRSVNHRFFNPSIKLPASSQLGAEVREAMRK